MRKRRLTSPWTQSLQRSLLALSRRALKTGTRALREAAKTSRPVKAAKAGKAVKAVKATKAARAGKAAPAVAGSWTTGLALGAGGARRFGLYQPPDRQPGEQLPLLVMLHGCGQDAAGFAASTRMNRVALRRRFLVLYPEQDALANRQGCWNWFATANGRAQAEAALILKAIDQACLLHGADPQRVAIAGLSAGAGMAALLVSLQPARFKALVMHSGIPPGTAHSTLTALSAMRGRRRTAPLAATPAAMATLWPPLLVIHGSADPVVSPHNGRAAVQQWAAAAGAQATAMRLVQRGRRHAMQVTDFMLQGRAVATHVAVDGLGHNWSGGLSGQPFGDGRGPDASAMIWAFVSRQFSKGSPAAPQAEVPAARAALGLKPGE